MSTTANLKSKPLAQRLADVEVLFLLSFKPMTVENLIDSLKTTFELSIGTSELYEKLSSLEAEDSITTFQKTSEPEQSGVSEQYTYEVTASGLKLLNEYIESLSEIVLTLQIGYNSKLG